MAGYARVEGEFDLYEPPSWLVDYCGKLLAATRFPPEKLEVYTADVQEIRKQRIGVSDNPLAFIQLRQEPPHYIVMPRGIVESDGAKRLFCHEFTHLLMADVDLLVVHRLDDDEQMAYGERVEHLVEMLVVPMMAAAHLEIVWINEDDGDAQP